MLRLEQLQFVHTILSLRVNHELLLQYLVNTNPKKLKIKKVLLGWFKNGINTRQGDVTNWNSTKLTEDPNASVRPLAAPGVCGV